MRAAAEAKKPMKHRAKKRATLRRRPTKAELERQCRAANAADKLDPTWQDLIHWPE